MVRKVLTYRIYLDIRGYDLMDIFVEIQRHGMMQDFITSYELEPTDEILSAQAMSFFIAGANTTANTMHYTLVELSNNPDILTKLHEEIDKVFEGRSEELTYKDIEKFHYLDKILNETMRKYPPIGIIQRLCSKDTVLPSGVKIAKGNIVLIPVFALHRDKKYYPNPDVFDPERFSSENDLKSIFNDFGENDLNTNNYVYLPFGAGNRLCFGYRFARLQMKVGLAQILRHFTLVEQNVTPKFERSPFSICSPTTRYELKFRDVLLNQD
ncbi:hypothetical protein PYW08_014365 [Mythimna loreyi]|uniref:Uncharacterized protein n=1 Tax=Mythimna loreyi TaxID=667449 RepID=A0ACC2R7V6_9NEOP|nr:hypothetical protein PYW08_014365 [Mythimna loreyi]